MGYSGPGCGILSLQVTDRWVSGDKQAGGLRGQTNGDSQLTDRWVVSGNCQVGGVR